MKIGVHAGEFTLRQMTVPIPSARPDPTRVTVVTAGTPVPSKLRVQKGTAEILLTSDATIREKETIQFVLEA